MECEREEKLDTKISLKNCLPARSKFNGKAVNTSNYDSVRMYRDLTVYPKR